MPIQVLPPEVANKIAAGEVVERPASVAKELIENAIDAGATDVRIDIEQGGRRLVRVSDNGLGIPQAEIELAFLRHATSKLQSVEDLFRISTLGFRGEALASIASVSRLTLSSRYRDEEAGLVLRLEGGAVQDRQGQARPVGTVVSVENLFYNTPARLKFMRSDSTEAGHVARLVTAYALSYPDVRFVLQNNGRQVLRTLGTGELYDVIIALFGLDVAEQMIELPAPLGDQVVRVWGYVGAPGLHRANRRDVAFFVNHRWIQDSSLSYALTQAYRTLQPQGRYPMAVVHIDLPPEAVDVNIHPTKREVRFRHANTVFAVLQRAVRSTIMSQRPVPLVGSTWGTASPGSPLTGRMAPTSPRQSQFDVHVEAIGPRSADAGQWQQAEPEPDPQGRLPMLRVVGQIAQTYIVAEGPGGLYLIDQHAAHERIRYEELKAQQADSAIMRQELLDPLAVELSPEQATLLENRLTEMAQAGFILEPFGGSTVLVRSVPASLVGQAVSDAIAEMLDAAIDGGDGFSWEDQTLITLSCHTAVRAGQTLSPEEMRDLIRQLERTELPHTCPHGRPTMLHLTQAQLEREFGRA